MNKFKVFLQIVFVVAFVGTAIAYTSAALEVQRLRVTPVGFEQLM